MKIDYKLSFKIKKNTHGDLFDTASFLGYKNLGL
jgi:hypothetical protein